MISKKKQLLGILFVIRCIAGAHIFYTYASQFGEKMGKWGTFVEGTTNQIAYLPYTDTDPDNKLYQHLLFEPCVTPVFSGTNIWYENTLCEVTTQDYENFVITVPAKHTWSDNEPVTIEDVYFTYSNILQENRRSREQLATYKNITIEVDGSQLRIKFNSQQLHKRREFGGRLLVVNPIWPFPVNRIVVFF